MALLAPVCLRWLGGMRAWSMAFGCFPGQKLKMKTPTWTRNFQCTYDIWRMKWNDISEMEWVVVDEDVSLKCTTGAWSSCRPLAFLYSFSSRSGPQGQRSLMEFVRKIWITDLPKFHKLRVTGAPLVLSPVSPLITFQIHETPFFTSKVFHQVKWQEMHGNQSLGFAPLYFLLYRGGYWAMGMDMDMTNPPLGGCGGKSWRCTRNELRSLGLFPSCVMAWKQKKHDLKFTNTLEHQQKSQNFTNIARWSKS